MCMFREAKPVLVLACAASLGCSEGKGGTNGMAASGQAGAMLYEQVNDLVTNSCSFVRCHSPTLPPGGGGMVFASGADVRLPLVGVQSCEYSAMNRVEAGKPEESWVMVKLTAPRDSSYLIQFTPDEPYTPHSECGTNTLPDGTPGFGFGMPATGTFQLDEASIDVFRRWIAAGAPGPM
jgi:hypothetical protein